MIYLLFLWFGLQLGSCCVTDRPALDCNACDGLVEKFKNPGSASNITALTPKPVNELCQYRCPDNYKLNVKSALTYRQLTCDVGSWEVKVDKVGEDPLSDTRKFTCAKCNDCPVSKITAGDKVCYVTNVCTMPSFGFNCSDPQCPLGSYPFWLGKKALPPIQPIACVGNNWMGQAITSEDTGLTCMYPDKATFSNTPPNVEKPCPEVKTLTSCSNCTDKELIYVPHGNGYRLTCRGGVLVTDKPKTRLGTVCNDQGVWEDGITEASCATDDRAVTDCLGQFTDPSAKGLVNKKCALGTCYFACATKGTKFQVLLNGVTNGHTNLKCVAGKVVTTTMDVLDASKIKCL